jgi:hypothetical protein
MNKNRNNIAETIRICQIKIRQLIVIRQLLSIIEKILQFCFFWTGKDIQVNIGGAGLGNQLFQYAFARWVKTHTNKRILLNTNAFNNESQELHVKNQLIYFNIDADFVVRDVSLAYRVTSFCILKILGLPSINCDMFTFQNHCERINEIRDILLQELTLKIDLTQAAQKLFNDIQKHNAVSIHIRRGDYLLYPRFLVIDKDYYNKAIKQISTKIKNPVFYVFSNDMNWVKENVDFRNNERYFVDKELGCTDYEELVAMSLCKHNIISNSTFAWWGAWLNQNTDKIVLVPKFWYKFVNSKSSHIIPEDWIEVENSII